ncbi:hypothetical protein M8818_005090 [Zalaria obscura]|uniref:Uncharacterized protein n=1 Tax=Zalaria obscura TaxID=2024903 RepID=A0ACC3SCV6_9PEZI
MYIPNSAWTWSFFMVAVVQAVIGLALERFQLSLENRADQEAQSRTIPTYLALFIFGFLYEFYPLYDALKYNNTIQVIGICFFNLALLIYAGVQTDQIKDAVLSLQDQPNGPFIKGGVWADLKPFLIAVPCVIALGTVLLSFIAWKLYDEFAWTIYKDISADLRMKRRYLVFQIYRALLKFDFFFFLGFTVQFLVVVGNTRAIEFWLTIAAIPITIIILVLADYWTKHESTTGMISIITLYFAALAYFLFKLVRMYDTSTQSGRDRVADYKPARRSLTTFAVITVLLLLVTIANACWCTSNFGKGLKSHVVKRKIVSQDGKSDYAESAHPLGQVPSRMTID